jgi:hypothetical protein
MSSSLQYRVARLRLDNVEATGRTALGDYFQTIADVEADAEEADELADAVVSWLLETGVVLSADCVSRNEVTTEGLVVLTGRNVFYSMTGENEITCPHCGQVTASDCDDDDRPIGVWQDLLDTIGVWYDGRRGDRPCPSCDNSVELNDWIWSPPWGFGYLGFTFWNWGEPLRPQFKAEVSHRLGHRTVYPHGKL